MDSLNDIWNQILLNCKSKVSDVMYAMWLIPLGLARLEGDRAYLVVHAGFRKDIILSKFYDTLKQAFLEVIGFEVELEIIVDENGEEEAPAVPAVSAASAVPDTAGAPEPSQTQAEETPEKAEEGSEAPETGRKNLSSFTFDNFIVGKSNLFAFNLAKAVTEDPGSLYNPVLIYGNSGLGKTHLMLAVYNELKRRRPNGKILYINGEEFLVDLVDCLSKKKSSEFRSRYRNSDALLVDDIQIIQKGEAVQEEFFHTFNALEQSCKQIVLTSDVPPKELAGLDERLKTRFEMGVLADIQPPDIDTRKAIVKFKSKSLGLSIPEGTTDFIAGKIKSNIRQLEGTVKKIAALKKFNGSMPSIEQVQEIIKDVTNESQPVAVIVESVFAVVSETYGVSKDDLISDKRSANITMARNICMYALKEITTMTLKEIGSFFNKNHATVLHSVNKCAESVENDPAFRAAVNGVIRQAKERE